MPSGEAPTGEAFTSRQAEEIERAIKLAEQSSPLRFSVYVGGVDGDLNTYALRLFAALGDDTASTVLLVVDPAARRLEIVRGPEALRSLDDRACALASATLTSAFSAGDLTGGIVSGLRSMAEHAR